MKWGARDAPIFAGGKRNHKTATCQISGRKPPLPQVAGAIGEKPTIHIYRQSAGIINLDPIRVLIVFVQERARVGSHKLADVRIAFRCVWIEAVYPVTARKWVGYACQIGNSMVRDPGYLDHAGSGLAEGENVLIGGDGD